MWTFAGNMASSVAMLHAGAEEQARAHGRRPYATA
jgi:hypothetical protein